MTFTNTYLNEATEILSKISANTIEDMVELLFEVKDSGGRLFILGVGGSAANASHAVNDFRKLAGVESYAPTDNISEITARTNDEGWETVFSSWLLTSKLSAKDAILILSVGGGSRESNVSVNLCGAIDEARRVGARILGIVGRDGGYTSQLADVCLIVPTVNPATVTPHSETFQALVWHLIVSHPRLNSYATKW